MALMKISADLSSKGTCIRRIFYCKFFSSETNRSAQCGEYGETVDLNL